MSRGRLIGLGIVAMLAAVAVLVALLRLGAQSKPPAGTSSIEVRPLAAGAPRLAEAERAAGRQLELQGPLVGAPARETFCAVELSAADGPLDRRDGRAVQAWGWASCQQVQRGPGRQLRGGTQSSEPVRVVLLRDADRFQVGALEAPQPGLDYEASMQALFPAKARRLVDQVGGAAFDARIDRLLCANIAAAGVRFERPGARLVGQGERCD